MSFDLVPHLPKLIAIVAKNCVKESEQFYLFIFILLLFFFISIFINIQSKQHKMLKKLNMHCYSYKAKKQFHGLRVLIVSD